MQHPYMPSSTPCSLTHADNHNCSIFILFYLIITDQWTDRPTDRWMDKASYRVACLQLKEVLQSTEQKKKKNIAHFYHFWANLNPFGACGEGVPRVPNPHYPTVLLPPHLVATNEESVLHKSCTEQEKEEYYSFLPFLG